MSEGREAKAAFKKATTWGTAVACGANDGVMVTNVGLTRTFDQLIDESVGQSFKKNQDTGYQTVEGSLEGYLRYDGLDVLIAMVMGSTAAPSQKGTGSAAYSNYFAMASDTDGLFGTLAAYMGFSTHEYPGAKVTGMTISGESGQPLTISFDMVADTKNTNTSTGTNNNTTIGTVTFPETQNRALFRHGKFWMNDATGAALDASMGVYPGKFTLAFTRNMDSNREANAELLDKTAEPTGNGFPDATLTLEFPEYTSGHDTFIGDLGNGTHKKLQMSFVGGVIDASYYREFSVYLPNLVITNADPAMSGAGKIPASLQMAALGTATERTGMTGIYEPFKINVLNTRTTSPLA